MDKNGIFPFIHSHLSTGRTWTSTAISIEYLSNTLLIRVFAFVDEYLKLKTCAYCCSESVRITASSPIIIIAEAINAIL
jgi:hypothetical protein